MQLNQEADMRSLGVIQFQEKKFDLLGVDGDWKKTLGHLPAAFIAIVYGRSGNGKTEFLVKLAKYLATFDKVAWISYEQRHGYDLQLAVNRNEMQDVSGNFVVVDPISGLKPGITLFEDFYQYVARRNSPKFYFIDSYDYVRFTQEEYLALKNRFGHKKTFIFISHEKNKQPAKSVAQFIEYDGGLGIFVNKFIAHVNKNRFGGFEPFVIWEERARELNPLFFKSREPAQ